MEEAAVILAKNAVAAGVVPKKIKKLIAKPELVFFLLIGSDKQDLIEELSTLYNEDEFRAYMIARSRKIILFLLYEEFYTTERLSELLAIELMSMAEERFADAPFELPANMVDIAGQVINEFIRETIERASPDAGTLNAKVIFSDTGLFSRFNQLFEVSGDPVAGQGMLIMNARIPDYRKPPAGKRWTQNQYERVAAYNSLYSAFAREVGTAFPVGPAYSKEKGGTTTQQSD